MKEEYNGFITKAKVIDTIKGVDLWTPKAEFGTAFHLVMENGAAKYYNNSAGKYVIQDDDMPNAIICEYSEIQLADEFHDAYGKYMTWEARHTERIKVDNINVILNMRFDALMGNEVHENKTTSRGLDVGHYERSMQWRIYLMSMQAHVVQYNVFPYKEPAPLPEGKTRRKGARDVREVSYYPMRFYHGGDPMVQDVNFWIRSLVDFCDRHRLMEYIQVKEEPKPVD